VSPAEQVAEGALQDAVVAALGTWCQSGVPEDPRAWLAVTARHKAYDVLRREGVRPAKEITAGWEQLSIAVDPTEEVLDVIERESVVRDDLLRLAFACCHPAREARVALSLRGDGAEQA